MTKIAIALAVSAALLLAGCIGGAQNDGLKQTQTLKPKELTQEAERRFQELASAVPLNYSFVGQGLLLPVVTWFNDTIDGAANTALEGNKDEGGTRYNLVYKTTDVTRLIPPGQPAKVSVKLYWYGNPGQSADLDIFVNVPGLRTDHDDGDSQGMNWNIPVKRMGFTTVGVAGEPHEIGVQASQGLIAPGQPVNFFLEITVDYARDVLTPYHPYAFTVPQGASGIILRSDKVGGSDHVKAKFVIVDPNDELVQYVEYNDLDIPSESIFIPTRGPGEYVFYAYEMTGGFLSLRADVPVEENQVRTLRLAEERVVDFSGPANPGLVSHRIVWDLAGVNQETPYMEGAAAAFGVDKSYPLRVVGFLEGNNAAVGDVQIRISSSQGLVFDYVRTARVDNQQGSLGFSGDHHPFVFVDNSKLAKGSYAMSVVVNGMLQGQIGHAVLTYQR
ncbi:MAG TPA: hypothetical protein VM681_07380 [Candidatus Thermoplasmatota archaeon]|nr:hypothetical protein [Candidatus Thermoplasmatota archaeon]